MTRNHPPSAAPVNSSHVRVDEPAGYHPLRPAGPLSRLRSLFQRSPKPFSVQIVRSIEDELADAQCSQGRL